MHMVFDEVDYDSQYGTGTARLAVQAAIKDAASLDARTSMFTLFAVNG